MAQVALGWLAFMLALGIYAWFRRAWLLPFIGALTLYIAPIPLGLPQFWSPPAGKYNVVGAKIIPNVAIYALLDNGASQPRYYKLPYSAKQANALQNAMDHNADGHGKVGMKLDSQGKMTVEKFPHRPTPPKQVSQPLFSSN